MSTISPLGSNPVRIAESLPRNTVQPAAQPATQSAGQVKPAYETAVPPIAELPEPPTELDTKPAQIDPVKKDVAEALIVGHQQQKLFDIYMSNSNQGETEDASTGGVALNTVQSTPTERSVAQAISQYVDQSQAEIPPENRPEDI